MPDILKIDGVYKLPDDILEKSNESRFDYIFQEGVWANEGQAESISGSGSTMDGSALYRTQLNQFLDLQGRRLTFFDAPCGDLNWVREFFDRVDYIGGDISGDLIQHLKGEYPHVNLLKFDIIEDIFPKADVWHCRHCLFHLSLRDIMLALDNFCHSDIDYALITNHFLPDNTTFDISTGNFRFLDLTNYPFNLPKPRLWLQDSQPLSGKMAMATGLWAKVEVEQGVDNYRKLIKSYFF